jgi:hypothetical protein
MTLDLLSVPGPTTDVACLLVHWPELAKAAVEAVVFLGSQPAGERCAVPCAFLMAAAGVLLKRGSSLQCRSI